MQARILSVIESLEQEFQKLFQEHYPLIYRTAYSVTGSREDAEDVVQTVFLRLYRRGTWASLKPDPRAYLYRAAVNEAISIVRSRRRTILTDDDTKLDKSIEAGAASSTQIAGLQGQFVEAISKLSPAAVEILILRYEHNYSDAEIAPTSARM